jgi:hypothetical protein
VTKHTPKLVSAVSCGASLRTDKTIAQWCISGEGPFLKSPLHGIRHKSASYARMSFGPTRSETISPVDSGGGPHTETSPQAKTREPE